MGRRVEYTNICMNCINIISYHSIAKENMTPFWPSDQQQLLVPLAYKTLTPLLGPAPSPHKMR